MGTAGEAESRGAQRDQQAPDPTPIVGYRTLASVYLALLVAPVTGALAPGPGVNLTSWAFTGLGGLVGGVAGFVVASRYTVRRWLTGLPTAVVLAVAPLGYVVWAFALFANNPGKTAVTLLLRPNTLGVVATAPVALAIAQATREATAHRVTRSTVHLEFTARTARRVRRIQNWSMAAGLGAVAGLMVVLFFNGELGVWTLAVIVAAVLGFGFVLTRSQTHRIIVTADGLAVDDSFTEWRDIEQYELTDDSLVFARRNPVLSELAFDVDDLDDVDEVREALDDHLSEAE